MDSHKICISFVPKATNFHFTSLCAVKVEHEITGEKAQMVVSYMPFRGLFAAFFDCACEKLITFLFSLFPARVTSEYCLQNVFRDNTEDFVVLTRWFP